jgi:hypothetical protein
VVGNEPITQAADATWGALQEKEKLRMKMVQGPLGELRKN